MGVSETEIAAFWDRKFLKENLMWGLEPSLCAVGAASFLAERGGNGDLLDIGCGYARDSGFFATLGFRVTGVDISEVAINKARKLYPEIAFRVMDIAAMNLQDGSFDVVFGNFILHLCPAPEKRSEILNEAHRLLKPEGYLFISVASVWDADYGEGECVGSNLFKNERGVIKYYYNEPAVHQEFASFTLIEVREIVEEHNHDRPHCHRSYFIVAQKTGKE
jgi:SAM-dependent methyltransferase